jgi:sec-independent protein translocase protein TatA
MTNLFVLLEFLSGGHIILIVFVLVLLFGSSKIPELMRGLGQGINEFKKASRGETDKPAEDTKEEKK